MWRTDKFIVAAPQQGEEGGFPQAALFCLVHFPPCSLLLASPVECQLLAPCPARCGRALSHLPDLFVLTGPAGLEVQAAGGDAAPRPDTGHGGAACSPP